MNADYHGVTWSGVASDSRFSLHPRSESGHTRVEVSCKVSARIAAGVGSKYHTS